MAQLEAIAADVMFVRYPVKGAGPVTVQEVRAHDPELFIRKERERSAAAGYMVERVTPEQAHDIRHLQAGLAEVGRQVEKLLKAHA